MGVEEDAEGLDPSEIPLHVVVSLADEVGIDVEVGVSDYAEISVFFAMKVEGDSIASNKSWVLAYCARTVAIYVYINLVQNREKEEIFVQKEIRVLRKGGGR